MDPEGHAQLRQAVECLKRGDILRAKLICERLHKRFPDHAYILHLFGVVLGQAGDFRVASECLKKAVDLNPNDASAHCNLGNVLLELKQPGDAIDSYDRAIRLDSAYAEAYSNRGNALLAVKNFGDAIASYDQAIRINPRLSGAYANRGYALQELDRFDESLADFDRAIGLNSKFAEAYTNRGYVKQRMGHLDAAIADYDKANSLDPNYADALWNKSLNLLARGNFDQGLKLYEWRWRRAHKRPRELPGPLWLGESSVKGKTVLLYGEQGLGDVVQFCRYAPLVAELGARVVLEVQKPLLSLLRSLDGVAELIERGNPLPVFDMHCPLLSLPLAFHTNLETIPNRSPYLHPQADKVERWSVRLGPQSKARVGIVWSGSTDHKNDLHRSIALQKLVDRLPASFQYFSLQKGVREGDLATLRAHPEIGHFEEELVDFSDTAALCQLMDVIISVDTSVAHVGAAIGKRTWVLVPFCPDWRWLLGRSDSPWYPTTRIFRQPSTGDWDSVLSEVCQALRRL